MMYANGSATSPCLYMSVSVLVQVVLQRYSCFPLPLPFSLLLSLPITPLLPSPSLPPFTPSPPPLPFPPSSSHHLPLPLSLLPSPSLPFSRQVCSSRDLCRNRGQNPSREGGASQGHPPGVQERPAEPAGRVPGQLLSPVHASQQHHRPGLPAQLGIVSMM